MGIRSIDFQVTIPKASEISKTSGDEQNRLHAMQQQQNASAQNRVRDSVNMVQSREKAEEAVIRERQQEKERNEQQNKNNSKKREKDKKNKELSDHRSSIIDIKI